MGEVSAVRKTFEDSLRKIDELIEGMHSERDRIKAEFERRMELVRFGQVDWKRFEEFFEEPYVIVPKRPNEWYVIAPKWLNFQKPNSRFAPRENVSARRKHLGKITSKT